MHYNSMECILKPALFPFFSFFFLLVTSYS